MIGLQRPGQANSGQSERGTLGAPFLGLYGACSSSMESLALGALIVDSQSARYVLCGASSHNATVEKQYRYPTEYGSQKPPSGR